MGLTGVDGCAGAWLDGSGWLRGRWKQTAVLYFCSGSEMQDVLRILRDGCPGRTDRNLMCRPWHSRFLFRASVPENPVFCAES